MTCGWAPDGRHFVTATTAPRLRVDNALYVYKYNGLLLHKQEFFMLLEAAWVPAPAGEQQFADSRSSPAMRPWLDHAQIPQTHICKHTSRLPNE